MRIGLVVLQEFEDHKKGERIEDAAEVARVLASESERNVVKVDLDHMAAQPATE